MTSRRGFIAQLLGAIAAGLAAPKVLGAQEYDPTKFALGPETQIPLDVVPGYGAAMIEDGGYEARVLTLEEFLDRMVRHLNETVLAPNQMRLQLAKECDEPYLLGLVDDHTLHRTRHFRLRLRDWTHPLLYRQVKYQTHMAMSALREDRRRHVADMRRYWPPGVEYGTR